MQNSSAERPRDISGSILKLGLFSLGAGTLGYAAGVDPTPSPQEICGTTNLTQEDIEEIVGKRRDVQVDRLRYATEVSLITDAMNSDGIPVETFNVDMQTYLSNPNAHDDLTHARVAHWNAVEESEDVSEKIAALLCEQEEDFKRIRRENGL